MGRSDRMFFPKPLNGIRWGVVFGLPTPSSLVQNSEELITRRNLCGLYNSWPCWELNCDRLALPECMAWSQLRAVPLLFLGYPLNRKLGDSRAFLDVLEKRQIYWACCNSNRGSSVLYPSHAWLWGFPCQLLHLEVLKLQNRDCESHCSNWGRGLLIYSPSTFSPEKCTRQLPGCKKSSGQESRFRSL